MHTEEVKSTAPEELLKKFFLILWFIENNHLHRLGSNALIRDLIQGGETILMFCKIRPGSSPFSELYGRLYRCVSQWNTNAGDPWMAMWQSSIGQTMSSKPEEAENSAKEALFVADRAFCLGQMTAAASTYWHVESNAADPALKANARLGRILCHKLLGEIESAWALATSALLELLELESAMIIEFKWQACLCEAFRTKTIKPLLESNQSSSPFFKARYALTTALIAYGQQNASQIKKIKRASTIKAHFAEVAKGYQEYGLYKMLLALEACYNDEEDILSRLKRLGSDLAVVREQGPIDEMLLFFAAAIRWLASVKRQPFLGYLMHEYNGTCLRVSAGKSSDLFDLTSTLHGAGELMDIDRVGATLTALPMTSSKILLKFSSLVAKASLVHFKDSIKTKFKSEPVSLEQKERFTIDTINLIIEEIGELKGPLLKLGQVLGGMHLVPLEARLNIQKALASTRGMPPEAFFDLFRVEQGKQIHEVFLDVQPVPIGIGSMGQVFKAKLTDGTAVAIKIHYPDLDKSVTAFYRSLKLFMLLLRHLFPCIDVDQVAKLIMDATLDECDMRKEGLKHQFMYEAFHGKDDIIIPRVFHEFTSKGVLVTEYIPGLRIFEFVPNASLKERQRFHSMVEKINFEAIVRHNYVQIDPHGGNYLYCQGKVACLDFGGLTKISPQASAEHQAVFNALAQNDERLLFEACMKYKIFDPKYISEKLFYEAMAPLLLQERHPKFDSQKHQFSHLYDLLRNDNFRRGLTGPPEFVMIFLAHHFLFIVHDSLNLAPGSIEAA